MDKRNDIMQAALELFADRGFYGTPVPLIADKANVGIGTIYRYFKDKEHLVNELYRFWKTALFKTLEEGLHKDQPLRTLFGTMIRRCIEFAADNRSAYAFLVTHHHGPYLDAETLSVTKTLHLDYLALFDHGRKERIFKDIQPEVLMAVVTGIISEIMKEYWAGRFDLTPKLIGKVDEICWQAIRA